MTLKTDQTLATLSQEESLFISQIGVSVVAVVWGSYILHCNGINGFCSRFVLTLFPSEMAFFDVVLIPHSVYFSITAR